MRSQKRSWGYKKGVQEVDDYKSSRSASRTAGVADMVIHNGAAFNHLRKMRDEMNITDDSLGDFARAAKILTKEIMEHEGTSELSDNGKNHGWVWDMYEAGVGYDLAHELDKHADKFRKNESVIKRFFGTILSMQRKLEDSGFLEKMRESSKFTKDEVNFFSSDNNYIIKQLADIFISAEELIAISSGVMSNTASAMHNLIVTVNGCDRNDKSTKLYSRLAELDLVDPVGSTKKNFDKYFENDTSSSAEDLFGDTDNLDFWGGDDTKAKKDKKSSGGFWDEDEDFDDGWGGVSKKKSKERSFWDEEDVPEYGSGSNRRKSKDRSFWDEEDVPEYGSKKKTREKSFWDEEDVPEYGSKKKTREKSFWDEDDSVPEYGSKKKNKDRSFWDDDSETYSKRNRYYEEPVYVEDLKPRRRGRYDNLFDNSTPIGDFFVDSNSDSYGGSSRYSGLDI